MRPSSVEAWPLCTPLCSRCRLLCFERVFQVLLRELGEAKVVIEDADPGSVEFLLAYLYTGVVDSHCNPDAAALLPLAHRLEVPDLVDHCAATLVKELSEELSLIHI